MCNLPHQRNVRGDAEQERWLRVIGEPVAYPVPTRPRLPEAFDVALKRKGLVVAAVMGRVEGGAATKSYLCLNPQQWHDDSLYRSRSGRCRGN